MTHEFTNESWSDNRLHDITMDMGGADIPTATQTTASSTTAPWVGQQPYLSQALQSAQNLYATGGPQYYTGQTIAAPGDATQQAQAQELQFGSTPQPTITAAQDAAQSVLSANPATSNPAQAMFGQVYNNSASPALATATQQATTGLPGSDTLSSIATNGSPNLAQGYLGSVADGSQLTNNPTLQAQWNAAANNITNAYQTATAPGISSAAESAGRFGSGSYANAVNQGQQALAGQLATAGSTLYGNAYTAAQQNQLAAANTIQQAQTASTGQQAQAASTLGTNALGATSNLGTIGQLGTSNQLAAASGTGTDYSNDLLTQTKALAAAPGVATLPLTQAGAVADVGSQQDAYQQALLNANLAAYNFGQTSPYTNLASYEGLINGNYGGSTVTSTPTYTNNSALLGNMATAAGLGASLTGSQYGAAAGLLPLIAS